MSNRTENDVLSLPPASLKLAAGGRHGASERTGRLGADRGRGGSGLVAARGGAALRCERGGGWTLGEATSSREGESARATAAAGSSDELVAVARAMRAPR